MRGTAEAKPTVVVACIRKKPTAESACAERLEHREDTVVIEQARLKAWPFAWNDIGIAHLRIAQFRVWIRPRLRNLRRGQPQDQNGVVANEDNAFLSRGERV